MKRTDDRSRRCFLKASSMLGLGAAFMPPTIGEAFADSRIAGSTGLGHRVVLSHPELLGIHTNFPAPSHLTLQGRSSAAIHRRRLYRQTKDARTSSSPTYLRRNVPTHK